MADQFYRYTCISYVSIFVATAIHSHFLSFFSSKAFTLRSYNSFPAPNLKVCRLVTLEFSVS